MRQRTRQAPNTSRLSLETQSTWRQSSAPQVITFIGTLERQRLELMGTFYIKQGKLGVIYGSLEVALMMISIHVFCFVPQNVWLENLANSTKRRGQEVELR